MHCLNGQLEVPPTFGSMHMVPNLKVKRERPSYSHRENQNLFSKRSISAQILKPLTLKGIGLVRKINNLDHDTEEERNASNTALP